MRQQRRRVEGDRLAYYNKRADAVYWDSRWERHVSLAVYRNYLAGKLGLFKKPFTRYLPRNGRILEAGCGMGQWVLALRERGYDVEGVDIASKTIDAVKRLFPELPIRVGDVTKLNVPDGFYAAYVSLGVIEHVQNGPEPFLREAHRILGPSGVALVSVPHFHRVRRLKAKLGLYRRPSNGDEFFQYAFTPQEFSAILVRHGFTVLETFGYDAAVGLAKELPFVDLLYTWPIIGGVLRRAFRLLPVLQKHFGNMILVAARRTEIFESSSQVMPKAVTTRHVPGKEQND